MCGIVGYTGPRQALPLVLEGLRRLEYRGYDSAGVVVLDPDAQLNIAKKAGRIGNLEAYIDSGEVALSGQTGMGHTRWATHGGPTDRNAHPHTDMHRRVALLFIATIRKQSAMILTWYDDSLWAFMKSWTSMVRVSVMTFSLLVFIVVVSFVRAHLERHARVQFTLDVV